MKVCTITKYNVRTDTLGKQKCLGNWYEKAYLRLLVTEPCITNLKMRKQIIPESIACKIRSAHSKILQNKNSFIGKIINKLLYTDSKQFVTERKIEILQNSKHAIYATNYGTVAIDKTEHPYNTHSAIIIAAKIDEINKSDAR